MLLLFPCLSLHVQSHVLQYLTERGLNAIAPHSNAHTAILSPGGKLRRAPSAHSHCLPGPCSLPVSCAPRSTASFRRRPGSRRPTEGQGGHPLVHSLVLGRQVQTRVTDRAKYPLRVRILLSPTAVGRGIPWCSQFPPAGHCTSHLHGYTPADRLSAVGSPLGRPSARKHNGDSRLDDARDTKEPRQPCDRDHCCP